jgi:rod shape-determining protein MreB
MGLFDFLTYDIAIDLGTANTLIIHNDKVVVDAPSIVAMDRTTNAILAIGHEAMQMHGKTHENIRTVRPLKDGVIADFVASEHMIREMIKSIPVLKNKWLTPSLRMVICIPSGITEVEKRAVRDSAEHANAKEVYLIHEPMAAAIGIGVDVLEPKGRNRSYGFGRYRLRQECESGGGRLHQRHRLLHAFAAQPLRRGAHRRNDQDQRRRSHRELELTS